MVLQLWFCLLVGSVDPHSSGVFAWRALLAGLDLWTEPVVSVMGRLWFSMGAGLSPDDHHWLETKPGQWTMLWDWTGGPVTTAWFLNSSQESRHLLNVQLQLDAGGTWLMASTVWQYQLGASSSGATGWRHEVHWCAARPLFCLAHLPTSSAVA